MDKPVVQGPIDGNVFAMMAAVTRALRQAEQDTVLEYRKRAMSGDYAHLLAVSMEYVEFDL